MRVTVLGIGPAGVNTCRALAAAGHEVFAQDDDESRYALLPDGVEPWGVEPCDVIVPQPDSLVKAVAEDPEHWFVPSFLPRLELIERCQAKGEAATIWHRAGLRGPAIPIPEPYPDHLHLAADELGLPFWLRADRGAGANKAIKVDRLDTAYHWIRFWATRGVQVDWIAEPYLPGRDLAWTSIWYQGDLVACFLRERLEYLYPHLSPEGLTGTPTRARIIHDLEVTAIASSSVQAVDDEPHGIYSVDLREDSEGVARPTEINAGRGFTTMGLWSLAGGPNYTALAAELALNPPTGHYLDDLEEGLTLSRHIDCGHTFTRSLVAA